MPKLRLTKDNISKIPRPTFGEVFYWDTKLKGFGLRVRPNSMTFIVQSRVNNAGSKLIRVKIGAFGVFTADAAEARAKAILGELAIGSDPNEKQREEELLSLTLRQLFDVYMADKKLRPKTRTVYKSAMDRCFKDWLDKKIVDITKDMVQKRHKAISNAHGPRGKGEAQADQAMRVLRCLLNYATVIYEDSKGNPILPHNPVMRLNQTSSWNKKRVRQDVIAPEDLKKWYDAVQNLENETIRDFLVVCLFTGFRRSEALKLTWKHINFEQKCIRIPEENTKTNREHGIPLSDFLFDLLKHRHKTMVRHIGNDFVFPDRDGKSHLVEPKKSIGIVCGASGVKFSCHTLRRTFETTAEGLDISHYALKALLNHSNDKDITGDYIVIRIQRLREPMQKISAYLSDLIKSNLSGEGNFFIDDAHRH